MELSGTMRAESNGILALNDGSVVKLEGLRLATDGSPALRQLVGDRAIGFFATAPKLDRYGRLRAHAVIDGAWLQQTLISRGLARVELAPDRADCARELYAAEKQARDSHMGLWASRANAVRGVFLSKADTGTFQIIEGKVLSVDIRNSRAYLNFGTDYKTDFTVTISPEDRKIFRAAKVDPRDYAGKIIRVRGIVQYFNGPQLEVAAPHQIEPVQ